MKRDYLVGLRQETGTTQQNIADMLGCYQSYYASIENGDRQQDMSLATMEKLSAAFNVPLEQIIQLERAYKAGQ